MLRPHVRTTRWRSARAPGPRSGRQRTARAATITRSDSARRRVPVPTSPLPVNRRLWVPTTVVALAAVVLAALYYWPDREFENGKRVVLGYATIILSMLILALWLLFLSG